MFVYDNYLFLRIFPIFSGILKTYFLGVIYNLFSVFYIW